MNKFFLMDIDSEKVILEFVSEDDDSAIAHVFSLFNPPPENYTLYQIEIHTDKNGNFEKRARGIELPTEITEDGDYFFS